MGTGTGCMCDRFTIQAGDIIELKGGEIKFLRNGKVFKIFGQLRLLLSKLNPVQVEQEIIQKIIIRGFSSTSDDIKLTTRALWNQDINKKGVCQFEIVTC